MTRFPMMTAAAFAALALGLTACGDDSATSTTGPTATQPPATAAPATAAPTTPPPVTEPPIANPATTEAPAPTAAPPATTTTTTTLPPATTTTVPGPLRIVVNITNGEPDIDDKVTVSRGDEIEIIVTSDTSDEVHVHGYDYKADVTPSDPAVITFVADLPGIYEVELESSHLLLFELEVR